MKVKGKKRLFTKKQPYYNLCFYILICFILIVPIESQTNETFSEKDPLKNFNTEVSAFNGYVDDYLLRPVAQGYSFITPSFIRSRFSNFFSNISEISFSANFFLQGEQTKSLHSLARLITNSTIGLLGFFDVASYISLEKQETDFGETLYTYGFSSGPYIVLPFRTGGHLRDEVGSVFDIFIFTPPLKSSYRPYVEAFRIIHIRSEFLAFDGLIPEGVEERYAFSKHLYFQNRRIFLNIEEEEGENPFDVFFEDE